MISKKVRIASATAVLAAVGFGITSAASARFGETVVEKSGRTERIAPMHDRRDGDHLEAAATALGMTSAELKAQLQSGKSLAEIATSKGVAVQKVIDAIVADVKAEIAEKVTDGKLTQAQADTILKDVTVRVTAAVNGEVPLGHGPEIHGGDHGKHGGRHDHDESGETTKFPGSDARVLRWLGDAPLRCHQAFAQPELGWTCADSSRNVLHVAIGSPNTAW